MGKTKVVVAEELKQPSSAFWLWQTANRDRIAKACGSSSVSEIGKKGAEMWKKASAADKKPFEEKYKKAKEKYDAYLKTPEGQEAMKALKEERKEAKLENTKIEMKKAAKAVEKDEALKKPLSAYFMWLNANREKVIKAAGSSKGSEVTKKAGEMWKAATDAEKAPFEKEAKALKEKYDAYLKTPEGEKAMQEFKGAQAAAKAEVKGASKVEAATSKKEEATSPKRGVKRKQESLAVDDAILEEARKLNLEGSLQSLAGRKDIIESGMTGRQLLDSLLKSNGLESPAKKALLGA